MRIIIIFLFKIIIIIEHKMIEIHGTYVVAYTNEGDKWVFFLSKFFWLDKNKFLLKNLKLSDLVFLEINGKKYENTKFWIFFIGLIQQKYCDSMSQKLFQMFLKRVFFCFFWAPPAPCPAQSWSPTGMSPCNLCHDCPEHHTILKECSPTEDSVCEGKFLTLETNGTFLFHAA